MLSLSQISQRLVSNVHSIMNTIGKMGGRAVKVAQSPNGGAYGVGQGMFKKNAREGVTALAVAVAGGAVAAALGAGYFAGGGAVIPALAIAAGGVALSLVVAHLFYQKIKQQ